MNKADLVARIAKEAALTKRQSEKMLEALMGSIQDALSSCGHMACDRMGESGGLIVLRQAPTRFWRSCLGYAGATTSVRYAVSPTRGIMTRAPDRRACSPAAPVVHHTRVPSSASSLENLLALLARGAGG